MRNDSNPDDDQARKRAQRATMRARVRAAADALEARNEAAQLARQQRDELIVNAIEAELASTHEVARWARLSQSRIEAILAAH